ncbi:hypothetical protein [Spartinivicinus poritis]|uniref:Uncharacterized protein n=1 Tax=Spartinivicinus poritis TaxID=2994640 RepID=A0ABT5U685_9GAMM|nr:hypothetical protein [Spartinivicinus sp. A2-2]MDE1461883.1 hypothetical protein [Spartinivicinus sp. A2-2]
MLIEEYKSLAKASKHSSKPCWLGALLVTTLVFCLFTSRLCLADSYQRLLEITSNPDVTIAPFTTDGCSGGMSTLWSLFDQSPVWEYCCILHDKVYWQGGTAQQRLKADNNLQQCVIQAGYPRLADLMYHAVRAGGGPCTGLPWRWGYGWPHCTLIE